MGYFEEKEPEEGGPGRGGDCRAAPLSKVFAKSCYCVRFNFLYDIFHLTRSIDKPPHNMSFMIGFETGFILLSLITPPAVCN